jgi:hypothetical protein
VTKLLSLLPLIMTALIATSARALSVSCSGKTDHVVVESGTPRSNNSRLLYPNAIEQDVWEGDDEGHPSLIEWNAINIDKRTMPTKAHCYLDDEQSSIEHVEIPVSIRRCILHEHNFSCQSGSISCGGNVWNVQLAQKTKEAISFDVIKPEMNGDGSQIWRTEKWFDETSGNADLIAYCFHGPRQWSIPEKMKITQDMKECRLSNKRFICSANPQEHNLFWPEK